MVVAYKSQSWVPLVSTYNHFNISAQHILLACFLLLLAAVAAARRQYKHSRDVYELHAMFVEIPFDEENVKTSAFSARRLMLFEMNIFG